MTYIVTDEMFQREIAISELRSGIAKAISDAVKKPRGITGLEILIALNEAATRWARELHNDDFSKDNAEARERRDKAAFAEPDGCREVEL